MKITILGAAGFIGTNLFLELSKLDDVHLSLVDKDKLFFENLWDVIDDHQIKISPFDENSNFDEILEEQDVVFHLVSTSIPSTTNQNISDELNTNIKITTNILESCVKNKVKKVVFISSGGTVYGKETSCPLHENTPTNPINAYGIQKITIEKILYLYHYMYGLDYRVIRLANPYGPYQRPNGMLGAVTTFTYKALTGDKITVYGDGSVIRDFIYIEDAIKAILNITFDDNKHKTFNLGSGYGTSLKEVLNTIETTLDVPLNIEYKESRKVDVPVNYLDISLYEKYYGKLNPKSLSEGIKLTANFLLKTLD